MWPKPEGVGWGATGTDPPRRSHPPGPARPSSWGTGDAAACASSGSRGSAVSSLGRITVKPKPLFLRGRCSRPGGRRDPQGDPRGHSSPAPDGGRPAPSHRALGPPASGAISGDLHRGPGSLTQDSHVTPGPAPQPRQTASPWVSPPGPWGRRVRSSKADGWRYGVGTRRMTAVSAPDTQLVPGLLFIYQGLASGLCWGAYVRPALCACIQTDPAAG